MPGSQRLERLSQQRDIKSRTDSDREANVVRRTGGLKQMQEP